MANVLFKLKGTVFAYTVSFNGYKKHFYWVGKEIKEIHLDVGVCLDLSFITGKTLKKV